MKNVFLIIISLLVISCGKKAEQTVFEKFEVKKGPNIAHWLSQSQRRGMEREQFFSESDVEEIVKMGFDHIRLPIDEEQMWDENGNRHDDAFQLMENCIDWCAKNDLRIIVDLHILRSHYFNANWCFDAG